MKTLRIPLAIALALGAIAAPSAQRTRTTFDPKPMTQWVEQARAHRAGSVDAAATAASLWSMTQLAGISNDVRSLSRALRSGEPRFRYRNRDFTRETVQQLLGLTDDETARGDVTRIAKLGLVLHTDIARFINVVTLPLTPSTTLLDDGQYSGDENISPHWGIARAMIELISSANDNTGLRWYRAMTADAIRARNWSLAIEHLDQALQQMPDDARLRLHAGVVHETFGSDDIQTAVASLRARGVSDIGVRSQREELGDAERLLRRAAELDPALGEARLRLGHVLGLQGHHDDAVQELRRAEAGTTQPVLIYYTMLFLGREEAAQSRYAEAQAALAEAMRRFPLAQSPILAECQLARRMDEPDRVAEALRRLAELPAGQDSRHDPWWDYETYTARDADRLINEFYAEFRGGPVK